MAVFADPICKDKTVMFQTDLNGISDAIGDVLDRQIRTVIETITDMRSSEGVDIYMWKLRVSECNIQRPAQVLRCDRPKIPEQIEFV